MWFQQETVTLKKTNAHYHDIPYWSILISFSLKWRVLSPDDCHNDNNDDDNDDNNGCDDDDGDDDDSGTYITHISKSSDDT